MTNSDHSIGVRSTRAFNGVDIYRNQCPETWFGKEEPEREDDYHTVGNRVSATALYKRGTQIREKESGLPLHMMTTPGESATSSPLVKELGLLKHPEGDRQTDEVPSPFVGGVRRSLATSIYYLLDYDRPSGVIHMNKSVTYHVLHQGQAEYTLITPGKGDIPPVIERKVIGTGPNETRQLLVGTGVWKMSKLLDEDVASAETLEEKRQLGCLITEVVVPGFAWEDHRFLTRAELEELVKDLPDSDSQGLATYLRAETISLGPVN
ncbi:unnamed protein product [Mycena citricolor]|uniref:DUF985 domain-containing protein n=1 Tax=Mycena citricolor TaxID=2018698 RepID=A0AAD2K1J9_9AGAR|nr:unnamed protein product [Mycena citricolor]